jgi:hypothetical protein
VSDRIEDYAAILHRAAFVFGAKPFALSQLAIETTRRTADVAEAIEALVATKRLERVEGRPVTYKVTVNG